jgi:hypothetical protein
MYISIKYKLNKSLHVTIKKADPDMQTIYLSLLTDIRKDLRDKIIKYVHLNAKNLEECKDSEISEGMIEIMRKIE